jgi:hypothetical protein
VFAIALISFDNFSVSSIWLGSFSSASMMPVPCEVERCRIRPRRNPMSIRMVTCEVNDFVAATPISGPACM